MAGSNLSHLINFRSLTGSRDIIKVFFKVCPWWPLRYFERPQLFHLNAEMFVKRHSSVLMVVMQRSSTVFERPFEKFERLFRVSQNTLKKHWVYRTSLHSKGKQLLPVWQMHAHRTIRSTATDLRVGRWGARNIQRSGCRCGWQLGRCRSHVRCDVCLT